MMLKIPLQLAMSRWVTTPGISVISHLAAHDNFQMDTFGVILLLGNGYNGSGMQVTTSS